MNKYREVIAGLRELATRLEQDQVLGSDILDPWISVSFQPGIWGDDEATINAVDTVSGALFGRPATTEQRSGGTWHHNADGRIGPIRVSVFGSVSDPAERDLRTELERLRAQLAEREAPLVAETTTDNPGCGCCGARSFTSSHPWEPDTQVPDRDGYLDWEVCGRPADDPIHHTDDASEVTR